MKLRYTRPALLDLDTILDHIVHHSSQGAARVQTRIQMLLDLLLAHPRIGVRTGDPTIRRINASPYPYLIFYEVTNDEIVVHSIRHAARNISDAPGTR